MPKFHNLHKLLFGQDFFIHPYIDPEPDGDGGTGDSGGATPPDDSSLGLGEQGKRAIATLRGEKKELTTKLGELQRQLEVFKGIDPEKAKQAEIELERLRQETATASKIKAEAEAELQSQYEQKLKHQENLATEAQQALVEYKLNSQLERAFYAAGGLEGEFDYISPIMRARAKMDKEDLVVLDESGEPAFSADNGKSRPMTLNELIDSLCEKNSGFARHFKSTAEAITKRQTVNGQPDFTGVDDPWEKLRMSRAAKTTRR